ncbi:hypothetical protein NNC19_21375 [Clostridium sp. SHJSY1]|uniref:hypothetical protein n=1 Tax=Clostridium sp. SHJSY1 TaxID=2942483 RepID=UPI0028755886|nr:hypothetical protein [Clostridium sp. SHJSY1]MDS0528242.1 hypothetical protein [Clostridium sp. SHJSY1]
MELDEKRLRELVIKAIQSIQEENDEKIFSLKKKLYVLLTEEWNSDYWRFFEEINSQNEYEVYAVISRKINNDLHLNNLKKFQVCKKIIHEKDVNFHELTEYITVFPKISRNVVVKTALCIDDTFETKWIFKSMEKGQRIIFLKSGLEKFSGKEPFGYRKKILDYYRTLLEFDIEISDFIIKKENNDLSKNYIPNNKMTLNQVKIKEPKKVITEKEVEQYVRDNRIILNKGDIITDMARDKAQSLNISIMKK